ncbi:O-methyltransferase [Paraflavitalea pollutisoli]|uniref:O-methyltransferase n=1 Tax=Paraflavitalea pollutisoli TaxID=3034143 RepID=UPI0023ED2DDA|nr:class I SAM-dependent methyltransferase [Paraflavitalea sp. H1-2-19X]
MFSRWQLAKKYIHYYCTAENGKGHGVHSPFVFDFIIHVLNDQQPYPAYQRVETLRQQLKGNETLLTVEDFGAGSALGNTRQRSIASIARNAAKSKKLAQLLYRIVQYYKPATVLELGTSLGVSAAYLALANADGQVVTGEGSSAVAHQARANFEQLGISNIQLVSGNFDETLPVMLQQLPTLGLAFLDGNHRLEPTVRYFEQLLPHLTDQSIVILDDIHWSAEMEQAWEQVKEHPAVTMTIDLFFVGLVLFRKDFKVKQHFTIRF